MADDKKNDKTSVKTREGAIDHLGVDPNDPRRVPQAEPNLSDLNAEDPEQKPEFQNPVQE
jgi:hypothetical protein